MRNKIRIWLQKLIFGHSFEKIGFDENTVFIVKATREYISSDYSKKAFDRMCEILAPSKVLVIPDNMDVKTYQSLVKEK